jgi:hypothetical protein
MEKEAKYLSKLVEKQLKEYDGEILKGSLVLIDPWWTCIPCIFSWTALCMAGAWSLCFACCAAFIPCCLCMEWLVIFPLGDACMMIAEQWCIYLVRVLDEVVFEETSNLFHNHIRSRCSLSYLCLALALAGKDGVSRPNYHAYDVYSSWFMLRFNLLP